MTETASVETIFCAMLIRRAADLARDLLDAEMYARLTDALAQNRGSWRIRCYAGGRLDVFLQRTDIARGFHIGTAFLEEGPEMILLSTALGERLAALPDGRAMLDRHADRRELLYFDLAAKLDAELKRFVTRVDLIGVQSVAAERLSN